MFSFLVFKQNKLVCMLILLIINFAIVQRNIYFSNGVNKHGSKQTVFDKSTNPQQNVAHMYERYELCVVVARIFVIVIHFTTD